MVRKFVFTALMFVIVAPLNCHADMGPKPSFTIYFDDSFVADAKPDLLQCDTPTCADQIPFREMGPQRFECDNRHVKESHSCFAMAYGFPPFLKLRINTKDKVYESEPFSAGGDIDASLKSGQLVLNKRWLSRIFSWW